MSKRQSSASAVKEVASTEEQQLPLEQQQMEAAEQAADAEAAAALAENPIVVDPTDQPEPTEVVDQLAQRKLRANNTTVVLVNRYTVITDRDGNPAGDGGIRIWGQQSMDVNFGTKTAPKWDRVPVQETPFDVWNNGTPLADQLQTLIDTTDWAVIRLYWDFSLKAADISYVPVKDKNGETVISRKTGTAKLEPKFRRRPAKKVYAFDTIAQSEEDSSNNEEILLSITALPLRGWGFFSALLQQCVQPLHANASLQETVLDSRHCLQGHQASYRWPQARSVC